MVAAERGGLGGHVDDQGTITVPAVTIDQVVAEAGVERVDYIKMDIEGAERDALLGARRVISEQSPRMRSASTTCPTIRK